MSNVPKDNTEYVLGFLFSEDGKRVLLINKLKPKWQRGKLNGIGGKIEPGEHSIDAMKREFREEAGLQTITWFNKGFIMDVSGIGKVYLFYAFSNKIDQATSETLELIKIVDVNNLPDNVTPNLRWLIPYLLDTTTVDGRIYYYNPDIYE